jgi:drug/metabolite transporter (DMT)-like permease
MGKKQFLGLILMLISGASFAFATIIARLINTTTTITAMTIAVSRFLIAAPLFWLLFPKSPFRIAQTKVRWQFILLGVIFSAASFTSNLALDRISPSIYTIILFTFPSLIVIYSLLAKKAIPRLTPLCLPLSILGLILAVFPFKGGIKVDTMGVILTLVNSVALAGYYIYSAHLFSKQPSRMPGSSWVFLGAFFVSLIALPFDNFHMPSDAREWLLLLTYGSLATIIPIVAANYGIHFLGAAQASMTNVIQPVLTVALSMLIFSEVMHPIQFLGAFLVILSVVLLQIRPKTVTPDAQPPLEDGDTSNAIPGEKEKEDLL